MTDEPSRSAAATLIGEAFAGSGPNAAHRNVVIGEEADDLVITLDGYTQLKTTWLDLS